MEKSLQTLPTLSLYHTDGTKITNKQYASKETMHILCLHICMASITEVNISEADRRTYLERARSMHRWLLMENFRVCKLEPYYTGP